jgi:hypothetical protein
MTEFWRCPFFTSPLLRGEVAPKAIRVRGSLRTILWQLYALIEAPHPNPLPVRTGRGNRKSLRSRS